MDSSYILHDKIGEGASATVYRATHHASTTTEIVAIKIIDLEKSTEWDEVQREVQIMSLLRHPNLVPVRTTFVVGSNLWLVMPLLGLGSCYSLLKKYWCNGFLDEKLIATIIREVLQGLVYLHHDQRVHRDIKSANILIGHDGCVQLSDFGVAKTKSGQCKTFTGTPCWMAPEVMEQSCEGYDEKADIWSVGITTLELAFGRAPYAQHPPLKVIMLTVKDDPPSVETYPCHQQQQYSGKMRSFVEDCLRKDPTHRRSAKELLRHRFVQQAKDNQYVRAFFQNHT